MEVLGSISMKSILIFAAIAILLTLVVQLFITKSTNMTEIQPYKVQLKDGDFEIRFYPPAILASVTKQGDYDAMRSAGFRDLAGYIFGGNATGQKIAMTSPVIMQPEEQGTRMSFVMPSQYKMEDLPLPNSQNLRFETTQAVYAAVYKFGGFANSRDIEAAEGKLKKWLETKGIEPESKFQFMAYNPPYQLIGRRNEVAVEIAYSSEVK